MGFLEDAKIIISFLNKISISIYDGDNQTLKEFEKNYCFLSDVQPLYTQNGLIGFWKQRNDNEIYYITDALNTHTIFLKLGEQSVIIGPYVLNKWNENTSKKLLKKCGVPLDMLQNYKEYQYSLPLITQKYAEDIAQLLISNTIGGHVGNVIHIDMVSQKAEELIKQTPEICENFESVNRRYAFEAQFKNLIKQGDAVKAFQLLEDNHYLEAGLRFISDSIYDKIAGVCVFRVLVRQAAIEEGLTPVFVDALSQEYAQQMHKATSEEQLKDLLRRYIIAFCYAIRKNQKNNYSVYVKRALQYIELQLNQQITMDDLCRLNNITKPYFSQLFHNETGKTVKQYIMISRCERAADLLENSNIPIQEISHFIGYDDTNYFSRVFKKVMNTTPQDYRKEKLHY
jgi:AraC-like DNA-binding protein